MYRHLDLDRIVPTIERLCSRIRERFPDSGLGRVGNELRDVAVQARQELPNILRPHWWIRVLTALAVGAIFLVAAIAVAMSLRIARGTPDLADILQAIDAAVNEIILVGIAIFFLGSLEQRIRRRKILRALHELRSIIHVIDAHQLTKDPEQFLFPTSPTTASSPGRTMTRFELARYLNYCTEMLSLASKIAAVYAQNVNDTAVLATVNDLESLVTGLSNKIWQKLSILDSLSIQAGAPMGQALDAAVAAGPRDT